MARAALGLAQRLRGYRIAGVHLDHSVVDALSGTPGALSAFLRRTRPHRGIAFRRDPAARFLRQAVDGSPGVGLPDRQVPHRSGVVVLSFLAAGISEPHLWT